MGFLPPVVATLIADTKEYTAKMDAAQIKMGELGVEAETTGGKLSSFANKAATGIVAAGVAAAVLSAKMATDFQSSMTLLVTGAGEAQKNIEMVSQGILAMAGTVGQTPKALADGMYLIESAGYHAAAGLTVLKAAAEGAAVGNAQLTTVAGALTTVMHDYNIPVSKANQVTSALIETVASGKTHLEDLGASLGKVIPTAATLGVSLAQVGAGMAVQTNAGMSARLAAMHLNATMLALAAPNKIAASTMDAFGLSAQKLTETMADPRKGLGVALQMMVDAVGSKFPKGSAEYVAALKAMAGGTVGLQTILDLTGTHAKEFATDATNIGKRVNGASKEVQGFALVQKDLKFQLESLKGSASSLAISFGQFMLPKLSTVAGWAAKVFSLFTGKSIFSKIADDSVIAIFVAAVALKLGKAVKGIFNVGSEVFNGIKAIIGKLTGSATGIASDAEQGKLVMQGLTEIDLLTLIEANTAKMALGSALGGLGGKAVTAAEGAGAAGAAEGAGAAGAAGVAGEAVVGGELAAGAAAEGGIMAGGLALGAGTLGVSVAVAAVAVAYLKWHKQINHAIGVVATHLENGAKDVLKFGENAGKTILKTVGSVVSGVAHFVGNVATGAAHAVGSVVSGIGNFLGGLFGGGGGATTSGSATNKMMTFAGGSLNVHISNPSLTVVPKDTTKPKIIINNKATVRAA